VGLEDSTENKIPSLEISLIQLFNRAL